MQLNLRHICLQTLALAFPALATSAAADELTYEKDVRPILKIHCFRCHGEGGVLESGLDLRLRRLVAEGGDSGAAITAGEPDESLLLERVRDGEMPPEEVGLRPSAEEIATIERWIAAGAVARRPEPASLDPENYITEEERSFWAFQRLRRHTPPTDIDRDRAKR